MGKLKIYSILTILACAFFAVSWGDLPKDIHKCKSSDNDGCIGKTVEEIFRLYPKGNPEFGMPDVSALNLTNLKISRSSPNSPIQISFEFIKCTVYGLETAKVIRTSGFDKDLKNVEMDVVLPSVKMIGDYEMTGKLLLLPINGKGKGIIDLRDVKLSNRVRMSKEPRNNKTYMKTKKYKLTIEPKQLVVNLENVFNGNPVLSKTINEVINENWRDVWTELQEGINHAIENILENVVNEVFDKLSLEEMYSD